MTPKKYWIVNRHTRRELLLGKNERVKRDGTDNRLHFMVGWPLRAVRDYCERRNWTLEEETPP